MRLPGLVQDIARRIDGGLPGRTAHERMAPRGRIPPDYHPDPPNARRAAVLVLLYGQAALSVLLIRRPEDGSVHGGQLAFPGGEVEAGDDFPVGTALREACEEVGLDERLVHILGPLSPLYIPVSNFSLVPVVAYADALPALSTHEPEVAELVELPLSLLAGEPLWRTFDTPEGPLDAPCYVADSNRPDLPVLWGATAMVASELVEVCMKS